MELIGYLGGILLAICGIPEVIRTIKDKRCHLGWPFLLLWFFGELFMEIYALKLWDFPLLFNYTFNLILVGIMLYYKIINKQIKMKKFILELFQCFFPYQFNYYSYLGNNVMNIYLNKNSHAYQLLNRIFILIDSYAKPKYCPRPMLRLMYLLGYEYNILFIKNYLNILLKGITVTNIRTKWNNIYDIKIIGNFPDPLDSWIVEIQKEILKFGKLKKPIRLS